MPELTSKHGKSPEMSKPGRVHTTEDDQQGRTQGGEAPVSKDFRDHLQRAAEMLLNDVRKMLRGTIKDNQTNSSFVDEFEHRLETFLGLCEPVHTIVNYILDRNEGRVILQKEAQRNKERHSGKRKDILAAFSIDPRTT